MSILTIIETACTCIALLLSVISIYQTTKIRKHDLLLKYKTDVQQNNIDKLIELASQFVGKATSIADTYFIKHVEPELEEFTQLNMITCKIRLLLTSKNPLDDSLLKHINKIISSLNTTSVEDYNKTTDNISYMTDLIQIYVFAERKKAELNIQNKGYDSTNKSYVESLKEYIDYRKELNSKNQYICGLLENLKNNLK